MKATHLGVGLLIALMVSVGGQVPQTPSTTPEEAVKGFISDFDNWTQSVQYSSGIPSTSILRHFSHQNAPNDTYWSFLTHQPHSVALEACTHSNIAKADSIITTLYVKGLERVNYEYNYHLVPIPGGWLIDSIEAFDSNSKQSSRVKWDINSSDFIRAVDLKNKVTADGFLRDTLNTTFTFQDGGTISFPSGKIVYLTGRDYGFERNPPFQLLVPMTEAHFEYDIGGENRALRITFSDPKNAVSVVAAPYLDGKVYLEEPFVLGIVDAKDFLQICPKDIVTTWPSLYGSTPKGEWSFFNLVPNHPHDAIMLSTSTKNGGFMALSYWGLDKDGKPVYLLINFRWIPFEAGD